LSGDLSRQITRNASFDVNLGELFQLQSGLRRQFCFFSPQVGFFRIGLGAYRYVFSGSHRHGARDKRSDACNEDFTFPGRSGGDANEEARRGNNSIVRAQHRGPEPSYAGYFMPFGVPMFHLCLFQEIYKPITRV